MYKEKISAVYQIKNVITGEIYVGSSKDLKRRWVAHKCPSRWKDNPNNKLYQDFQKYGLDKFEFLILAPVEPEHLRQVEQEFIDMLKPTYNNIRSKGHDVERYSEYNKEFNDWYMNRVCLYNGETLKLNTLRTRFSRVGIKHPSIEAKKYLVE